MARDCTRSPVMSLRRMHNLAVSLIATGLIVVLMGMGGSWGAAYGQSVSGPTPTIGVVAPNSGAEGTGPSRNTAVAGESSELAGESSAEAVAGEAGEAGENGVGNVLENTGADSALQWPLLATGVLLFAAGAVLFARTRKTH